MYDEDGIEHEEPEPYFEEHTDRMARFAIEDAERAEQDKRYEMDFDAKFGDVLGQLDDLIDTLHDLALNHHER